MISLEITMMSHILLMNMNWMNIMFRTWKIVIMKINLMMNMKKIHIALEVQGVEYAL